MGEPVPTVVPVSLSQLKTAASLIRHGRVVGVPTETRYALAANALDPKAVERVLTIKGRQIGSPMGVILSDLGMLDRVAEPLGGLALKLAECHWPGPLTLVVPTRVGLPAPLLGADGGVGVRVSPDPVVSRLAALADCPLTATSANRSGVEAATTAAGASLPGVDLVLDDGLRDGLPSTVVLVREDGTFRVLRPGPVHV